MGTILGTATAKILGVATSSCGALQVTKIFLVCPGHKGSIQRLNTKPAEHHVISQDSRFTLQENKLSPIFLGLPITVGKFWGGRRFSRPSFAARVTMPATDTSTLYSTKTKCAL